MDKWAWAFEKAASDTRGLSSSYQASGMPSTAMRYSSAAPSLRMSRVKAAVPPGKTSAVSGVTASSTV